MPFNNKQAGEVQSNNQLGADFGLAFIADVMPEVLADLLQLPSGCYIDAVTATFDQPGVLRIRVRGAGWPALEGMLLQRAKPTITEYRSEDGVISYCRVDWGLPNHASSAEIKKC